MGAGTVGAFYREQLLGWLSRLTIDQGFNTLLLVQDEEEDADAAADEDGNDNGRDDADDYEEVVVLTMTATKLCVDVYAIWL